LPNGRGCHDIHDILPNFETELPRGRDPPGKKENKNNRRIEKGNAIERWDWGEAKDERGLAADHFVLIDGEKRVFADGDLEYIEGSDGAPKFDL